MDSTAEASCLQFDPFEDSKGDCGARRLNDRFVTARKLYFCDTCGGDIHPGERHRAIREAWEGTVSTFRCCPRCCAAMAIAWEDDGEAFEQRAALHQLRSQPDGDFADWLRKTLPPDLLNEPSRNGTKAESVVGSVGAPDGEPQAPEK